MKLSHSYTIVIIIAIIILIIIIIILIKKPQPLPPSNTGSPGPVKPVATTPKILPSIVVAKVIFTTYNMLTSVGSLTLFVTDGNQELYNNINFNTSESSYTDDLSNCVSLGPSNCQPPITNISYVKGTTSYLNFITNNTTNSKFYIYNPLSCQNFTLNDTSNGQIYDMLNVAVTGNVITFTTNGNTLTLNFANVFSS